MKIIGIIEMILIGGVIGGVDRTAARCALFGIFLAMICAILLLG
jgi:hypothetical protein